MNDKTTSRDPTWRTAGGDNTRRGLFNQALQIKGHPVRTLHAEGAVQASVVFDGQSRTFVADMAGTVQAFSRTGRVLWRVVLPGAVSATPALPPDDAGLFIGTDLGWVYALDVGTGKTIWRKQIPTKADPRILSDLLYLRQPGAVIVNSWGGRFYALDAASGAERFSWEAGLAPYAGATAAGDGTVYCLRAVPKEGVEFVRVTPAGEASVLHRVPEDKRGARRMMVAAMPVVDEERALVYFVANRDRGSLLHAWLARAGQLQWQQPLPNSVQATPALRGDGLVLIPDLAGFVHAIRPDGTLAFRYASGCEYLLAGAVAEAGGTSFFGDPLGVIHRMDRRGTGKPLFEAARAVQSRLSFDPQGNLYVPCTDHEVYVFAGAPADTLGQA